MSYIGVFMGQVLGFILLLVAISIFAKEINRPRTKARCVAVEADNTKEA